MPVELKIFDPPLINPLPAVFEVTLGLVKPRYVEPGEILDITPEGYTRHLEVTAWTEGEKIVGEVIITTPPGVDTTRTMLTGRGGSFDCIHLGNEQRIPIRPDNGSLLLIRRLSPEISRVDGAVIYVEKTAEL